MVRGAAILYAVQRLATDSTGRGKKFSLLQNRLEWFWEQPSLLCSRYRCSFSKVRRPDVKLNTHLHLRHRLGLNGAIPLLPLLAFMVV